MTTAGRVMRLEPGSWLCDVPLPPQRRGSDEEEGAVCHKDEDGLLRSDRWRRRPPERRRSERLQQCTGVLAVEPFGDPLVRTAVEARDKPDHDDLQQGHIDEADPERRSRLPEQRAERYPEGAVDGQDEPDGAHALGDVGRRRPGDRVALVRRDDDAVRCTDRKDDEGHDPHPGLKHDHATHQGGQAARMLGEYGLQGSPRVLRACGERAQHEGHRGPKREAGAHDVVDKLIRIQDQYLDGLTRSPGMGRLVPLGRVKEHHDACDEAGGDQEGRPKTVLAPFRFDAGDHDPCFSPVSWKKASSSDLSNGLNSLTPMPAAMSRLLISRLPAGSVCKRMKPSFRLTAATPNMLVSRS